MDIEAARLHLQFALPELRQALVAQAAAELIRESVAEIVRLAADSNVPPLVVVLELMAAAGALANGVDVATERERINAQFAAGSELAN